MSAKTMKASPAVGDRFDTAARQGTGRTIGPHSFSRDFRPAFPDDGNSFHFGGPGSGGVAKDCERAIGVSRVIGTNGFGHLFRCRGLPVDVKP
jgi:hypothetical protein